MGFYRFFYLWIDAFATSSAQAVRGDRGTEIPLSPLFETSCVTVMEAEASGILNPMEFLASLMGKKVIVTLKMDQQYIGTLTKTDTYMNLADSKWPAFKSLANMRAHFKSLPILVFTVYLCLLNLDDAAGFVNGKSFEASCGLPPPPVQQPEDGSRVRRGTRGAQSSCGTGGRTQLLKLKTTQKKKFRNKSRQPTSFRNENCTQAAQNFNQVIVSQSPSSLKTTVLMNDRRAKSPQRLLRFFLK
ncbi:hypothetical protein CEXT_408191 [Caerostris extrusa]|uniref:Sm domain-containing protein n=1 Tax=Caerostris extrusa TaxID=172846 RepID=A0AAV4NHJ9_CAEEX|nr:hypothetical protein CEXT_408191 [Caerostris extrusa]